MQMTSQGRRRFFGQVLGGLAVALGVKAAPKPLPYVVSETVAFKPALASRLLTDADKSGVRELLRPSEPWRRFFQEQQGRYVPVMLTKGPQPILRLSDVVTIKGIWGSPRVITSDVTV